ncbi:MAG: GTP-binding protein [Lachnospiraceae bacterium]|nr:GTP-binding protein [Lachnospiraceae bacterium]
MTKIDIVSGFLGAGKTTLIKKLLAEALNGSQTVLIENEFGEIGIDGGFLKDAGIEIREMNSGCICCSLVGDFGVALKEVLDTYHPDRIIIEPSGVGKLSDVMKAVNDAMADQDVLLNSAVAVVDAKKAKMYAKNFGEFFINQIEHAGTVILSRTGDISDEKLKDCVDLIKEHNDRATVITTVWDDLSGKSILETIEGASDLEEELMKEAIKAAEEHEREHHHHHHYDENGVCSCGHHHDDDDDEHEHHHHDHDDEHEHHHHDHDDEHEHHHHDHDDEHEHHHHDHDHEEGHEHHHHHHHADDIFGSWGYETPVKYTKSEIEDILDELDTGLCGAILRAKGMVPDTEGGWIYFDYVPGEKNIRSGEPDVTGKFCVIGAELKEDKLEKLIRK